ncbi:MAG: peptidoglycan-binding protein [Methylotenera sp.]|nr:peptidoglycan-binding protein [Methylotenera sp.]
MQVKLKNTLVSLGAVSLVLVVAGCATMDMGSDKAKTTATGSAGGANAQNANATLEKCDKPLGTLAVVEDQNSDWYRQLTGKYNLGSTAPVLKLMVQQSNCFMVVDRGAAMALGNGERNLRDSGEMRQSSNFKKGQLVAADYAMNPTITFSSSDTGGMGAGLAGFGGGWLGVLAGGLKFADASTMLTLVDNRSSVQVAAAEGSARNTDFSIFGGAFGGALGGAGGGYTKTPEGKVIVAAFTDSYNNIVKAVKNYKAQTIEGGPGTGGKLGVQGEPTPATEAAPAPTTKKKRSKKK